ncbi:MAG: hypothetical protein RLY69_1196, partial [Verrucomicrobiota bacterium]
MFLQRSLYSSNQLLPQRLRLHRKFTLFVLILLTTLRGLDANRL